MFRSRVARCSVAVAIFGASVLVGVTASPAAASPLLDKRAGLADYHVSAITNLYQPGQVFGYRRSQTFLSGPVKLDGGTFVMNIVVAGASCDIVDPGCTAPYIRDLPLSGSGTSAHGLNLPFTGSCTASINPDTATWMRCMISVNGGAPSLVRLHTANPLDPANGWDSTCLLFLGGSPDPNCVQYVVNPLYGFGYDGYYIQK